MASFMTGPPGAFEDFNNQIQKKNIIRCTIKKRQPGMVLLVMKSGERANQWLSSDSLSFSSFCLCCLIVHIGS